MRRVGIAFTAMLVLTIVLGANAGSFLVVDQAGPADVIVVLAGETDHRPARGLQLLDRGYAPRVLLDVPAQTTIFGFTELQLAKEYASGLPRAAAVGVCPIEGLSTRDEAHDVEKCLAAAGDPKRILIVTSDFHTRRALSIFRHALSGRSFAVAAARDETQFGPHWWSHRQWAKTCLDEWLRLLWWQAVDRWR